MQEKRGSHHCGFLPELPLTSPKLLEGGPRAKTGTECLLHRPGFWTHRLIRKTMQPTERMAGLATTLPKWKQLGMGRCRKRERCYGVSGHSFHDSEGKG